MSPGRGAPAARRARPALRRPLRLLVGCPVCFRQFDASGHAPGDALRCLCGERLVVRGPASGAIAIVRCSACGAPREPGTRRCDSCRAPFARQEHDRNTVCSGCAARISDAARYCPSCGMRIDPQGDAGVPTERPCPACEPVERLSSRAFPDPPGSFLECGSCAGIFLGRAHFAAIEKRARLEVTALPAFAPRREIAPSPVVYRLCPECGDPMHRRNFAARSGVVLDVCGRHGIWFDADELERVLDWIRSGQLQLAEERAREEARADERRRRTPPTGASPRPDSGSPRSPDLLDGLDLEDLARFVARLFRAVRRALAD